MTQVRKGSRFYVAVLEVKYPYRAAGRTPEEAIQALKIRVQRDIDKDPTQWGEFGECLKTATEALEYYTLRLFPIRIGIGDFDDVDDKVGEAKVSKYWKGVRS